MADFSPATVDAAGADEGGVPASPCEPDLGLRRRHRPDSATARITSESFVPGVSVNDVATRHGVTASTLSQWRGQAVRGELGPVPGVPRVPAVPAVVLVGEGASPSTSAPIAVFASHLDGTLVFLHDGRVEMDTGNWSECSGDHLNPREAMKSR